MEANVMTKRIVSGIFILTALGALGVILAGALTSGEQLIVRFLTAVIVAALGLYVISDLRLQADDDAAGMRTGAHPRLAGIDAPPNSTAAFMATVTGKGESPTATNPAASDQDAVAGDEDSEPHRTGVGTTSSSTSEHEESAVVEDAGSLDAPPVPSLLGPAPVTVRATDLPALTGRKPATITDLFAKRSADESVDRSWPSFGVGSKATEADDDAGHNGDGIFDDDDTTDGLAEPAPSDGAASDGSSSETDSDDSADTNDDDQIDELVATETTDLPATADFAYSGALEAPVFEWPSAPGSESGPIETGDTGMVAAATMTTTIAVERTEDDRADDLERSDADLAPDTDEQMTVDAITDAPPLPSPFIASAGTSAVEYADAPLAPIIDLRHAAGSSGTDIDEAISSGEVEVVAALIEQGMLSTDGPISDRDVRTMVYVAFTSNELRKLLAAGGSPDSPNPGIDLGPVELFKDGMVQPPKTLYPGPPVETEARSQLG